MATAELTLSQHYIPQGAYVDQHTLIQLRALAKNLHLEQRKKALSVLAGPNKTNFRGRGIDFEEVRSYQAGDDVRNIDWRVTARSDGTYTKLFREERERPSLVVADQRQGMFFGSQHCFKSVLACNLASLFAWSSLNYGDRVGAMVIGNQDCIDIKPSRNRRSVLALNHQLMTMNHKLTATTGLNLNPENTLYDAIVQLRRVAKPGSAIYLISDFSGATDPRIKQQLFQLAKHCEITALFTYDPIEAGDLAKGRYEVSDGDNQIYIDSLSKSWSLDYKKNYEHRVQKLQQLFSNLGVPFISISTCEPILEKLHRYYGARR